MATATNGCVLSSPSIIQDFKQAAQASKAKGGLVSAFYPAVSSFIQQGVFYNPIVWGEIIRCKLNILCTPWWVLVVTMAIDGFQLQDDATGSDYQ